ncbi:FecR domain-containing protein [Pandoraea sp. ISTKB]|uniref:FecR domain-containing protein n=1 Tax=Pandoraea sp. ISTKB TaxID=1586708 RepID=UPI0008462872|nr:FecR domain-containing protein [Pandoraea sp. ISTKB]ODP34150.1 histidine kinase [Pandoraea sp. ISTKB]
MPAVRSSWYDATADAAHVPAEVAERAVEWLIELQSDDVSPHTVAAWQAWREAHPDHERAWQRIESVKGKLAPLAAPVEAGVAQAALAPPASKQRRRAVKSLVVLLFAGSGTWGTWGVLHSSPWQRWSADVHTAVGERRTLRLDDGTQLVLNTDTAVDIVYRDNERRVRLIAGEVLITTAPDTHTPARAFLIETAQGTARALGTRYTVRQFDDGTHVSVFKGAVEIRPRDVPGKSLILPAGKHASYTASSISEASDTPTDDATWADGFIVARSMRLADFVAELARYSNASLTCDASVANLRVSGTFPLDDVGKVLDTLGTTLAVRTEAVTRFWGAREIRLVPA